ncbi:MAG: MATE family efflux transporter [Oscillospiraceae bacterium]|nr:MATE family efflux transporter [Oscillospiraceae bacterium]
MTKNMTEGSPLRLILSFSAPMLLGNLLQQVYNMADAMIVGHYLGADALAGVGASSSVQFLVIGFCIGICAGFGIPFARHFGARRHDLMRRSMFNAFFLAALFSVVLTLITTLCCTGILHLLKTPDKIFSDAYDYLFIIFLGIPFTIFYNLMSAVLRAVGDSRTPFIFLVVSTILNIAMDLLFIIVLDMGCAGAAVATVTAQGISAFSCFFYTLIRQRDILPGKADMKINGRDIGEHFLMGIPMGLQYSITAIGSMVLQSANNGLGEVYISAFTAGMKIKQLVMCPFDAVATGVSVFISQNIGAGKPARAKQGIIKGLTITVSYGLVLGVLLWFAGRTMTKMFVDSAQVEILDAAGRYLRCIGLFYWAIGFLNVCRMSIQGLGYSMRAIVSGVLEMIARIAVSTIFVPLYGFTAICFADQAAWVAACVYVIPMCFHCLKIESRKVAPVEES